jgi:hypothetical protein
MPEAVESSLSIRGRFGPSMAALASPRRELDQPARG